MHAQSLSREYHDFKIITVFSLISTLNAYSKHDIEHGKYFSILYLPIYLSFITYYYLHGKHEFVGSNPNWANFSLKTST